MPGRGFKVKFAPFTNPWLAVLMFPWSLTAHMLLLHKPTWDSMQEYEGTSLVRMDWKIQDFWALWKFWEFKGIAIWFSAAVNPWKAQCAHRISHPFCEVDLNNQGHCLVSCNTQTEGKKLGTTFLLLQQVTQSFSWRQVQNKAVQHNWACTGWITPAWKISMSFNSSKKLQPVFYNIKERYLVTTQLTQMKNCTMSYTCCLSAQFGCTVNSFERAILFSFITLIHELYYRIAFPQLFYLLVPRHLCRCTARGITKLIRFNYINPGK